MNIELMIKIVGVITIVLYIRHRIWKFQNDILIRDSWHQHIVNHTMSVKEFYKVIEDTICEKGLPDVYTQQVSLYEEGWLSRKRLYLRVTRKRVIYFISAFQEGKDFFISYRMGHRPALIEADSDEQSFFQNDGELAFIESMHKIVLHAVDSMTKQYGNRQLPLRT